jgi:hypothetical protein
MRFASLLIFFTGVAATILVRGATRKVDFSDDTVGQSSNGFEFGYTAKVGAPGKWVMQAEGPNKYLAQTDPDSTRSRLPVAVLSDVSVADVDLAVRVRPVSGRVDQAAGLVWRGLAFAVFSLAGCRAAEQSQGSERTVTIYVSTDRVFSEPVLRAYEQRTGVRVNAVSDTEETKRRVSPIV